MKCFAVSVMSAQRTNVHALMDSEETPNVASPRLLEDHSLKTEKTNKVVTVASRNKSEVVRKVSQSRVKFEDIDVFVAFFVMRHVLFDILIGRST